VWQLFFTGFVIFWTFWREWPWTHTVFVVLHVFVLLMKQHAYSFYNGYCKLRIIFQSPSLTGL
jgi:sterol O-acyltransferase